MKTKLFQRVFIGILLTMGLSLATTGYARPKATFILEGTNDLPFSIHELVILAPAPPASVSMLAEKDRGNLKVWAPHSPLKQTGKNIEILTEQNAIKRIPQNGGYAVIKFDQKGKPPILERINLDQSSPQAFKEIGITAEVQKKGSGSDTEYLVTMKETS